MGDMRILPMGQSAMLVELDGLDAAMALFAAIEARRTAEIAGPHDGVRYDVFAGVREVVPAARTVLVRFDPLLTDRSALSAAVRGLTDADVSVERTTKDVTVPVMYDGEDLQSVADLLGVSAQEIVARHAGHAWRAAFELVKLFVFGVCFINKVPFVRGMRPRVGRGPVSSWSSCAPR